MSEQEAIQIPRPRTTYGPLSVILDGEDVTLDSKIEENASRIKGELAWAKLTLSARGDVPDDILKTFFREHFWNWRVTKIDIYRWMKPKRQQSITIAKVRGRVYKIDFPQLHIWMLVEAIQTMIETEHVSMAQMWRMLTSVKTSRGTLLDLVSSMTLEKVYKKPYKGRHTHFLVWGCHGDCNPDLNYCTDNDVYKQFIDFFSAMKGVEVKVGMCYATVEPEMQEVTLQKAIVQERPTGKTMEREHCLT